MGMAFFAISNFAIKEKTTKSTNQLGRTFFIRYPFLLEIERAVATLSASNFLCLIQCCLAWDAIKMRGVLCVEVLFTRTFQGNQNRAVYYLIEVISHLL